MKTFKTPFLFSIIITICLIVTSCLSDSYTHTEYLVLVDSIHAPAIVTANVPFDIEFFGTIGTNGCCNFNGFNQNISDTDVSIRVSAVYDDKAKSCPTVMVYLDGRKFNTSIPNRGTYIIKIIQPNSSTLDKQITVN